MPRHSYDRLALRCAYQIQDTLRLTQQSVLHDHARWVMPVLEQFPQLAWLSTQLARAVSQPRYANAATIADRRLRRQLQATARDLRILSDQLDSSVNLSTPALRDLLGELDQLDSEFGAWDYDDAVSELSVTTEPIRLEGIELGRFEVRLRLGQPITQMMGRLCWVEALEANPAASNSEVTHPHVSGGSICIGDAGPELLRALHDGRVCDFFLMVRSILCNYNPGSPYVALDEWYGEPCSDCGRTVHEDDRYVCDDCDRMFCDDCITSCQHCDKTICFDCVTTCRSCKESSCADCLTPCEAYGDAVCPDCLDDNQCTTCMETQHEQEDNEEAQTTHQETPATQHPPHAAPAT